jgi:hypothetical protein
MTDKKSYMLPGMHLGADPEFFTAWTLYDISPTSPENLTRLMTIIANRGQPLLAGIEIIESQDLADGYFGTEYNGVHRVCCLKWIASGIGQMSEETLAQDAEGIVMQLSKHDTVKLPGKIVTSGSHTNTFFIRHDSF